MNPCSSTIRRFTRPFSTKSLPQNLNTSLKPSKSQDFLSRLPRHPPSITIPHLSAKSHTSATNNLHVALVSKHLANQGVLKVTLNFTDPESTYLKDLIISLSKHHGHKLPISHSASGGWFWDVRPSHANFQTANHQARSETMDEFPWHTDCSYEEPVPRYIALHVLQHDRFSGGTFSIMDVARLMARLSSSTRQALQQPHFKICIPKEFIKDPAKDHIIGKVVSTSDGNDIMRLRMDILSPLTSAAERALGELNSALKGSDIEEHAVVRMRPSDLPSGSVVLMDNRRWLHGRSDVNDQDRHLRRVRWDAVPFEDGPATTA